MMAYLLTGVLADAVLCLEQLSELVCEAARVAAAFRRGRLRDRHLGLPLRLRRRGRGRDRDQQGQQQFTLHTDRSATDSILTGRTDELY